MSAATMNEGRLLAVIVPRKWVDAAAEPDGAYHLSAAIGDYVNDVQQAGVFARHEMPAKAMQAYHADYYLSQVNNGGHSQFIGNSGELLRTITADALAGLEAMGAGAQHQILTEMAAWAAANPADAGEQDGFGVRAAPLDGLDKRFYAAESEAPIASLAARWITGWPELRVVEDEQYTPAIEEIAASNPHLAPRLVWKGVQEIRYQLTDPLQIAVAAACGAVEPQPEIKTGVGGGFYLEIEGQQCLAFVAATQNGERLCVPDDGGARLYEHIQQSPLPEFGPGLTPEDLANYKPPLAGARLSTVSAETIQRFVDAANETQVPEAIDLMLRKAGLGPEAMITACLATDGAPLWIVITERSLAVARCFPNGAQLRDHEGKPVASVTKAEIEQHAAEAAAAGATMRAPA
jgi:hypothetical protein